VRRYVTVNQLCGSYYKNFAQEIGCPVDWTAAHGPDKNMFPFFKC